MNQTMADIVQAVDTSLTHTFNMVEEPDRLTATDPAGDVIVGAQMPRGELVWKLYMTDRITDDAYHRCHPVLCSREGARQWVEMIAHLYMLGHQAKYARVSALDDRRQ